MVLVASKVGVVTSELVIGLEIGNTGVKLGCSNSSNSVEGCSMN